MTRADLTDYERGYIDGLEAYSWYHPDDPGQRHVGTTGRTLIGAVATFMTEERGTPTTPEEARALL